MNVQVCISRLRSGIERTERRLAVFESRYDMDTARFLREMTAEGLNGGDLEYVEWAGEAQLLQGLTAELKELEQARYQIYYALVRWSTSLIRSIGPL